MTKVIVLAVAAWLLLVPAEDRAAGQQPPTTPGIESSGQLAPASTPAEKLYLQLRSVGLDKNRVYRVRDLSFSRSAIHITLSDGTIAFTQDVAGRVTGAYFEGDGEVLLMPPDRVERASMALFTGSAILEEPFDTAYFRFNDDLFEELRGSLRPADSAQEFITQWGESSQTLASTDALRLMLDFSQLLPAAGHTAEGTAVSFPDHMLHASMHGQKLGVFDIYFDTSSVEQIQVGQSRVADGTPYYDVWTSFTTLNPQSAQTVAQNPLTVSAYRIRAVVKPPTDLEADAVLQVENQSEGLRSAMFELSRVLQIERVEADGVPVEYIHNPSIEGTDLARRGNDLVAVIFPEALRKGRRLQLRFVYRGQVLSAAGGGLLYVGARGTWYPNRGPAMADFDLTFQYPSGWTLAATGKRVDTPAAGAIAEGIQSGRWVSEKVIPVAGFNLGRYTEATSHAGAVAVRAYAAQEMERSFPQPPPERVMTPPPGVRGPRGQPILMPHDPPSPAHNAPLVADAAAHDIQFYESRFGPFPYSSLSLAQVPGVLSQGWPGLIFLSSFAYLTAEERAELHLGHMESAATQSVVAHETAHQWWGDLVGWKSYRDQWIVESLAEYSSLLLQEAEHPAQFRSELERNRQELLQKNKNGSLTMDAGPVTLGSRLSNSEFPGGYAAISYGRGAWLFHMLRSMMRDATSKGGKPRSSSAEEPFLRALRRLREKYEGKNITTHELMAVFAEELPPSLWYEGKKSLDWFEDGWVNGTAIPRIELDKVRFTDKTGATMVTGTILQKDAPDDLVTSVPIYASVAGKNVLLGRVFAEGESTEFHLTGPAGIRKVVVDPNQTLLTRR